jgi:acyl carrier protein
MADTRERLICCFQAVFPDLPATVAPRASVSNMGGWDSIATTNLAAAVEEEFDIRFDPREIEELTSFQAFLGRLNAG